MSVPPSRAQSDVFGVSASQYGGAGGTLPAKRKSPINYFILPIFVLEVIGLACMIALFYYLRFSTLFPYKKREFWCRDNTIMYRNLDNDQFFYVSPTLLYLVCFFVPPVIIIIGEIMFWLFSTKPRKTVYANCRECKVHLFTRRVLRFIAVFYFGALLVCIFTDFIKLMTGYHRPYFLTLCRVNYTLCREPFEFSAQPQISRTVPVSQQATDPLFACLNWNSGAVSPDEFRYAWMSFPSLYATLSSFSMIFAALYIHFMISLRGAPLLRPFLIGLLLAFAILASFSRINGYKNHWVDIWVGWFIGFVTAVYLCWNVLWFQEVYHIIIEKPPPERISPFFSWFKLPRVRAPSRDYSVYTADESPPEPKARQRDRNRTYEVTTTTESFHRTIHPPTETVMPNGINY